MSVTFQTAYSVNGTVSHPILGDNTPSSAVLSSPTFTTSDVNVFTVVADPESPNGCIITSVNPGSALLSGTVVATEKDGTVHTIPITPDPVTVTAAPPPPAPQAVAAGMVYGVPYLTAPPSPPSAPPNS